LSIKTVYTHTGKGICGLYETCIPEEREKYRQQDRMQEKPTGYPEFLKRGYFIHEQE
jgi:hypothetical protein